MQPIQKKERIFKFFFFVKYGVPLPFLAVFIGKFVLINQLIL